MQIESYFHAAPISLLWTYCSAQNIHERAAAAAATLQWACTLPLAHPAMAASCPSHSVRRTQTRSRATTAPMVVPVPTYSCLPALQGVTGRPSLNAARGRPLSPHRQPLQMRRLLLPASPNCSSLPCCVPLLLASSHTQGAAGRGRSTSTLQDVCPRRPWVAVASRRVEEVLPP